MADLPYGIDPSIVGAVQNGFTPDYLQGGGSPPGGFGAPQQIGIAPGIPGMPGGQETASPDPSYGLPPSVLGAVQNGFAPNLALPSAPAPMNAGTQLASAPAPPPVAAPQNSLGVQPPLQSVTGGALPTQDPAGLSMPAPAQPDIPLGTVNSPTPQEVAKSNAAYTKQQAAQAAFAASPEGLAQKADAQNTGAIDKERQANANASAAEQAQNEATKAALATHMDRQAAQQKIDDAKTAQDQANVAKYQQLYAQQIQDAAKYKVNTDRSVGARGMLAIALSGIGDALDHRHGPNAAVQILDADADKRIADQWAQKKDLGDTAASTKGVLDVYRSGAEDDRQAQQFQKAAELSQYADEAKLAAARAANPQAKARAEAVAAGLDQKVAAITQGEATRKAQAVRDQQEQANKQAQLGVSYGDLALRRTEHADQVAQQDRAFTLQVAQLEAAGHDKEAADLRAQKTLSDSAFQRSLGFAKGGKEQFVPVVNQDGQPYAGTGNKDIDTKLNERDEGYVGLVHAYDAARQLRHDNGGSISGTEDQRKMAQAVARAQLKYMQANGLNRVGDVTLDQAEKVMTGGKDVIDSFVKNIMPNLDNAREVAQEERLTMHRDLGRFTGDASQFMIADPLKDAAAPSFGDQLSRSGISPEPVVPVTAYPRQVPDVINNFSGGPRAPTVPAPPTSARDEYLKRVLGQRKP